MRREARSLRSIERTSAMMVFLPSTKSVDYGGVYVGFPRVNVNGAPSIAAVGLRLRSSSGIPMEPKH